MDEIISPQMILMGISEYYNIDLVDITSNVRCVEYILPRQMFTYLCREMTDLTLMEIAKILNRPDHCNIFHDVMIMHKEKERNEEVRKEIEDITFIIKTFYRKS